MKAVVSTPSEAPEGRPGASRIWTAATSRTIKADIDVDISDGVLQDSPLAPSRSQLPNAPRSKKEIKWKHPAVKPSGVPPHANDEFVPDTSPPSSSSNVENIRPVSKLGTKNTSTLTDHAKNLVPDDDSGPTQTTAAARKLIVTAKARRKPTQAGRRNQGAKAKPQPNKRGKADSGEDGDATLSPILGSAQKTSGNAKSKPTQKRRAKPSLLDSPEYQHAIASEQLDLPKAPENQETKPQPKRRQAMKGSAPKLAPASKAPSTTRQGKTTVQATQDSTASATPKKPSPVITISSDSSSSDSISSDPISSDPEIDEIFQQLQMSLGGGLPMSLAGLAQKRPPGPQQITQNNQQGTPSPSGTNQVDSPESNGRHRVSSLSSGIPDEEHNTRARRLGQDFSPSDRENRETKQQQAPAGEKTVDSVAIKSFRDNQSRKRHRPLVSLLKEERQAKKFKLDVKDVRTPGIGAPPSQAPESPKPQRFWASEGSSSDPFMIPTRDNKENPTTFTQRLLDSAPQQTHVSRPAPSKYAVVRNAKQTEQNTDEIARSMLKAFQTRQPRQEPLSGPSGKETHDSVPASEPQDPAIQDHKRRVWREATGPYSNLGQTISIFVNKLVRHLKSKDKAIDDVADEYRQGGHQILDRMERKHRREQRGVTNNFEKRRGQFIKGCEDVRQDVRELAARLESTDLHAIVDTLEEGQASAHRKSN